MKKYKVTLTEEEREELKGIIRKGKNSAHVIRRARILLKADEDMKDKEIAEAVETSIPTIERIRKRFVMESMDAAIYDRKRPGAKKTVMDGEVEAHLIALSCSDAPEGYARWTLKLLSKKMVELSYVEHISKETVRLALKKTRSNHG